MKKLNNKGFSLVELIIVIAIMAVLIAVLAPQFLRYVERSRLQSDNTAIGELANACKVAATDEDVTAEIVAAAAGGITITIPVTTPAAINTGNTNLDAELLATIPQMALTSNTYVGGTAPTITLTITSGVVNVNGANYVAEVGATAGPIRF